MDPSADVLDISSDEEDGNSREVNVEDDYSWLSEFLDADEDDDNSNNDGSNDDEDDVVVVEEKDLLNSNPKQNLKPCVKDLDDDCMILDGDPDKPVEVQNDEADESDDEVLVVSEKGQVACRDYPHARHLCAAHPFTSSPHESHCDQCHCYVCDCRVPCLLWGTGDSYIDHCHATDKDDFWVVQRKSIRNGEMPSPKSILKPQIDIPLPPIQPVINNQNQIPLSNFVEPNYVSPVTYSPISIRPNPNIINPSIVNPNYANNHRLNSYVVPRNRLPTNFVSQNRSNGYNSNSNNNSPRSGRNLSPHSVSQRPVFKRSASFGSSTATNRHVYSSSNNAYVPYVTQSQSLPVLPLAEQNPYWINSSINVSVPNQPTVLPCQSKYLVPHQQSQVNPSPTYGAFGRFETSVPSQSQTYNPPPVFGQESQTCGDLPSLPETDIGWVNPCGQTNAGNDHLQGGALQADTHTSHLAEFNEPLYPDILDPSLLDFESWGLDSHPPVPGSNNTFVQSPKAGPLNSDILFNF